MRRPWLWRGISRLLLSLMAYMMHVTHAGCFSVAHHHTGLSTHLPIKHAHLAALHQAVEHECWPVQACHRMQATMRMPAEQRRNFVAVNKSFQARRQVLLDQRQAIYARLQRQSTRYNNAEDTIAEFLKVGRRTYLPDLPGSMPSRVRMTRCGHLGLT